MTHHDTEALRKNIIAICRKLTEHGINQGTSGNLSVRVGDHMVITPSGVPYDQMTAAMLARVSLADGTATGPMAPSTEWPFHRALFNARPDIAVVLHAHPVHCTALAMNREPIPACHYMIAAFGGDRVEVADYALFGSQALSDYVVTAMADRQACLMANHGATVVGETLDQALWRMAELETLAKGYSLARGCGTPHILSKVEIDAAIAAFETYGPKPTKDV